MAVSNVRAILLSAHDDVAAALDPVEQGGVITVTHNTSGETVTELVARQTIPFGHKVALHDIAQGHRVNRYGFPIGIATTEIKKGEHVHCHNMRSMLSPVSKQESKSPAVRPAQWVHDLVNSCLQAVGAHSEGAQAMATAVTEAHLRGVETHGLRRLRPYVTRLRSGGVNPKAQLQADQNQALLKIDGRNGIGHHVAAFAANAVSDAARQFGIAIALVRNSNHFGFAGYYATLIAGQGQVGIVTSNGQVCVAPEGSTKPLLSNNPIAIAAPTGRIDSYLELDLATSVTSRANVVETARSAGLLPDGWAQDEDGKPTRDPAAALAGSLLAFGGEKGFGLLVALEALTGVLSGGAYAHQVSSKEAAPDAPEGTAHTLIAIELEKAIGAEAYARRLDDLLHRLKTLPTRTSADPIRYPGERRWDLRRQRLREGVPLSDAELGDVVSLTRELGIKNPVT
jgi:LDH2 family malate/lactate/ureidoglycolate dehydrogenase